MVVNLTIEVPQPYNKIGDGPEGPEVRIMTDHLSKRITNGIITYINTNWNKLITSENWHQGCSLLPAKIIDVTCVAKFIYWTLQSLATSQIFYLTCTVIMTGKWLFKPGDYTKAIFYIQHDLTEPITVKINNQSYQYHQIISPLFFDSQRGLGKLIFKFQRSELDQKLKDYGPDLLQVDVTLEDYIARIRLIRSETMSVCKFLLEQKYFSGIGNYLKSEILFRSNIHPRRKIKSLSDQELNTMLYWSKQLIRESYLAGGVSISDYESPTNQKGQFKLYVYQQHKVDSRISYAEIDKRGTYWREDCQY